MNDLRADQLATFCDSWWRMVTNLIGCQWNFLAGHQEASLKLMEGMLAILPSKEANFEQRHEAKSQTVDEFRQIHHRATERVRQGLARPKEVYEVPYRDWIDWTQFPEWARPSDPELFQGCSHEG